MLDSSLVWDEMDMNAVSLDFGQLFPEFTFDGKTVFGYIMQGRLWEAVKALGNGITDALEYQRGELRTLFLTILILGIVAALFSNFADLFKDHQVSDLAFYFVYLLLITVLLKFFCRCCYDCAGDSAQCHHFYQTLYTYLHDCGGKCNGICLGLGVLSFAADCGLSDRMGLSVGTASSGLRICASDCHQWNLDGREAGTFAGTATEDDRRQH